MTGPTDRSELLAAAQAVAAHPETAAVSPSAKLDDHTVRTRRRASPTAIVACCVAGWAAVAWVWIAQPSWLFGAKEPPLSPAQEIAQQRFAVYLTRGRVEAFRGDSGYYPASMRAVGDSEDGVVYQRTGSGYLIQSAAGGLQLRLTDRTNPDSFLGNSLQLLSSAGQ